MPNGTARKRNSKQANAPQNEPSLLKKLGTALVLALGTFGGAYAKEDNCVVKIPVTGLPDGSFALQPTYGTNITPGMTHNGETSLPCQTTVLDVSNKFKKYTAVTVKEGDKTCGAVIGVDPNGNIDAMRLSVPGPNFKRTEFSPCTVDLERRKGGSSEITVKPAQTTQAPSRSNEACKFTVVAGKTRPEVMPTNNSPAHCQASTKKTGTSGTEVTVTNTDNGHSCVTKINQAVFGGKTHILPDLYSSPQGRGKSTCNYGGSWVKGELSLQGDAAPYIIGSSVPGAPIQPPSPPMQGPRGQSVASGRVTMKQKEVGVASPYGTASFAARTTKPSKVITAMAI